MHGDSDDRAKEQHEVTMEMNAVKRILYGAPFLQIQITISFVYLNFFQKCMLRIKGLDRMGITR
jgi:hypothetical protein